MNRSGYYRLAVAAVAGLAVLLLAAMSAGAATTTVVVYASDLEPNKTLAQTNGKWLFYQDVDDTVNNALGTFVVGPMTPPLGAGSVQISTSGTSRPNLATYRFSGTVLASITTMSFSTYNPSAGNPGSPNRSGYLHFNVDFDGSDTWQRRLIFLPSDNGTVTQNTWKTWDTISGGNALWRYSGPTWPGTATPGNTPRTWSNILSSYPGVRMRVTDSFWGIRVGEPYPDGYTENIDKVVFGTAADTTTFDFEPGTPVDLGVTKTDNRTHLKPGVATTYTIVVTNHGLFDVSGFTVFDNPPNFLNQVSWTCTASAGSACAAGMGNGTINQTGGTLKAGGTLTYQLTATLKTNAPQVVEGATFTNTVTVTTPMLSPDTNPMNNSASDTNTVDTRAPEAEISFNETTRDIEVRGRDVAGIPTNPVPGICTAPGRAGQQTCLYRIVDGAGNATSVTLQVTRTAGQAIDVIVLSVSYNGASPVRPQTNNARFEYSPPSGTLARLVQTMNTIDQYAPLGGVRRAHQVVATYTNPPGSTVVEVRKPGMSSSTYMGLALLKLVTQNGGLVIELP